jgi:hypothetical protein
MRPMTGPVSMKLINPAALDRELMMTRATNWRVKTSLIAGLAAGGCLLTWAIRIPFVVGFGVVEMDSSALRVTHWGGARWRDWWEGACGGDNRYSRRGNATTAVEC